MINWIIITVIGYLLGAIPFGVLMGKLYKTDIRQHGSGNIGFTNVWRVLGIAPAAIVLAGDFAKGYWATWLGFYFLGEAGALWGGVMALLGHTASCFIGFKGGKGIATGAGIIGFMSPLTLLICLIIVAIITLTTKYMSLGTITAAVLVPVLFYLFHKPFLYVSGITIACLYVVYRHRSNIKRLLNGTENKIGKTKES